MIHSSDSPGHGALVLVRGCPEVQSAVMASTTVESLSNPSRLRWDITSIFASDAHEQNEPEVTGTPKYFAYACKFDHFRRETFVPSSSLERIDSEAFRVVPNGYHQNTPCGPVEIRIPDCVREMCEGCFQGCENLRRVTFGPSSSLKRIGASCFKNTGVEYIVIPDGVRELCEGCFQGCGCLWRVTFGPASSLERFGASCLKAPGVDEVLIPDGVREMC